MVPSQRAVGVGPAVSGRATLIAPNAKPRKAVSLMAGTFTSVW